MSNIEKQAENGTFGLLKVVDSAGCYVIMAVK